MLGVHRQSQLWQRYRELRSGSQASAQQSERAQQPCWARAILGGPPEQLKQALDDCDEALRLRPNDPYAFDSRRFVYLKMGNFEKAIADYDQSIFLGRERAGSLYGRGIAKLKKGDADGGNKDIMAATKKRPDVAEEYRGYGVQP